MTHRVPGDGAKRQQLDPEVVRTLARAGLSRRSFLRGVSAGGAVLAGGGLLAACGIEGQNQASGGGDASEPVGAASETAAASEAASEEPVLNFENWIEYIDVSDTNENVRPSLAAFTKQTGIKVNYGEGINSNDEYFAKIRAQLEAGEDIGEDIIVLTDWMAGRLVRFGWLETLNHDNIPNMKNLKEGLRRPDFDPERQYSLPWQSGLTGIGYNPKLVGKKITSVNDLFDSALKGKVTFLTEMRDTMGVVMAGMGMNPLEHEFSDYEKAIEKLQEAVSSGQVRAFTGNDYVADLAAGNIGAAIAWSGDVIQAKFENPQIEWVIPDDGALLWSDNMLIPANAQHRNNAEKFMNYVYEPAVAAQIAAWVNYITPVEGAQEAIAEIDPSLAENELIFPTSETLDKTFDFKALTPEEEREYQDLFQSVIGA